MCPPIGNKLLYVTSGHYAKYGKDAFQPIHTPEEGEEYFSRTLGFYRILYDLELYMILSLTCHIHVAEFGTVCRYEQSGELHGLTRVRSFTEMMLRIFCCV